MLSRLLLACAIPLAAADPASVDRIFEQYTQPSSPGCAVGVRHNGRTVHAKGYGFADLEQRIPLTPQSRFYMASVSKQFTAAAAVLALDLDAPLSKYIPEIPGYAAAIPVRRLLDHTAGLRDYLTLWSLKGWSNESVLHHEPTLALILRQRALDFDPGTAYSYSNSGYFLISEIIARVTGQSLDAYLQGRLFRPLGMSATRFQTDHSVPIPNRAHGHTKRDGEWRIADVNFDAVGSGGLYSNVEDMLRWAAYFDTPKGAALLHTLSTPGTLTTGAPVPGGYALGLSRQDQDGLTVISHGGSATGYKTHFAHWPPEKLTVVTLCNATADAAALARRVAAVYHGHAYAAPAAAPKPKPEPSAPDPDGLEGSYFSPELNAVWTLVRRDGALWIESDGAPRRFGSGAETVTPVRDAQGRVTALTVSAGRAHGIVFDRRP